MNNITAYTRVLLQQADSTQKPGLPQKNSTDHIHYLYKKQGNHAESTKNQMKRAATPLHQHHPKLKLKLVTPANQQPPPT